MDAPLTEAFFYILLAVRVPNHGYGITQEVSTLTGGRVQLGPGTLYGALQTLEKKQWIRAVSDGIGSRGKKEYLITPKGKRVFYSEVQRLRELTSNARLMEDTQI